MRILVATANKGKIIELKQILGEQRFEMVGLEGLEATEEIETGSTFAENALLKAHYYHRLTGLPTIADDSGLEVDALGGAPGIYSARYGGPGAKDADRTAKLLGEIKDVPPESRSARFVCAAAFVCGGLEQVFVESVRGLLLTAPRGSGGFGYDPIFFYEPLGKTFAELTLDEKIDVGHRGLAFRRLARWLNESRVLDTVESGDKIIDPTAETSASER
jgi:XTP/dITP diphosphohydrolase